MMSRRGGRVISSTSFFGGGGALNIAFFRSCLIGSYNFPSPPSSNRMLKKKCLDPWRLKWRAVKMVFQNALKKNC